MAKRPINRSQVDDTLTSPPPPQPRARRTRANPTSPGETPRAPVGQARPIELDPDPQRQVRHDLAAAATAVGQARPVQLDPERQSRTRQELAPWQPSEEEIRVRAYHRFLERGGAHGQAFDDWIEAERELKLRG